MSVHYEVQCDVLSVNYDSVADKPFTKRTAERYAKWLANEGGFGDVRVFKVITERCFLSRHKENKT